MSFAGSSSSSDNEYEIQLDTLRAAAVSMVLYAHFAVEDSQLGHLGVRLFFVLSGFLITRILLRARPNTPGASRVRPLLIFYARRALRIFPAYYIMLAVVLLVGGGDGVLGWHAAYLSNFFYAWRNGWDQAWYLAHTWTLSIEEQFYLIWPFLMLFAPQRALSWIAWGAIAISIVFRLAAPLAGPGSIGWDVLPPASMDALGLGALLAIYNVRERVFAGWIVAIFWLLFAVSVASVVWRPEAGAAQWVRWIVVEITPLPALAWLIASASRGFGGAIGALLCFRPFVALGRISYGIYLFHLPILAALFYWRDLLPSALHARGLPLLVVGACLTILTAALSWSFVERPLRRLKPGLGGRAATALEAPTA
jgi:peptidoglycan/LPS O-acetylase OafA/YrhL